MGDIIGSKIINKRETPFLQVMFHLKLENKILTYNYKV